MDNLLGYVLAFIMYFLLPLGLFCVPIIVSVLLMIDRANPDKEPYISKNVPILGSLAIIASGLIVFFTYDQLFLIPDSTEYH